MKKTILTLLLIAGISGIISAQALIFGVKGGLNYSRLGFDEIENVLSDSINYSLAKDKLFQGFHVGLMCRLNIFDFYLQPELLFNTSGGNIQVESNLVNDIKHVKYNKIDLPVLLGLRLEKARINAGPVASVILSTDSELGEIIPNLKTISKHATLGFQAGAGLDLGKSFTLDLRYEGGLSKIGDKLKVEGEDYTFDSRDSKIIISLGYFFK